MKTIAITGASGVVGARALERLLAREDVGHVVALGRRPLAVSHPKLVSRVVDVGSAEAMRAEIPDGTAVAVCCLGTTMKKAGSKEAFRAIDRDAVVAFGRAAAARGAARGAARALLVSSVGADARSRNFYLKTKGEAEEALAALGFAQLTVLRPSFIDDEGARTEVRLAERIGLPLARAFFAVAGRTHRYAPITADAIAKALVHLAFDETTAPVRVVESDALHALAR